MNKYLRILKRHLDKLPSENNLSDEQINQKKECESSLYKFVNYSWPIIEGNRPFISGWHVEAICEHLEALYRLEIKNLLINIAPRCGKSNICSVIFPAWIWIKEPNLRFLYTAYAQHLSVRDSVACRRLITSEWYQSLWGDKYTIMSDVNNKLRFDNSERGYRLASSVSGTNTGQGGDFVICDDPNNIKDVESEVIRESINEWWDFVMSTRFCNAQTGRRLVIQQRTHIKDLSGHILSKDDPSWIHLCLPMEFERDRRSVTIPLPMCNGKTWRDPRKKEGELLWPEGMDKNSIQSLKRDFRNDSYIISSQLQQRPTPADGGIIKREWFKTYKEKEQPNFTYIIQSWDTALTVSKSSCYSACTTWGVFKDKSDINNIMLLSLFREKIEYPDLRKIAIRLANNYEDVYFDDPLPFGYKNQPDLVLIEGKVSGYSLISDLMRANIPVMRFDPGKFGDKIGRTRLVSHLIENGLVWLPTEPPKCEFLTEDSQLFIEAAMSFPNDESNDIIDSMSQAFIRLTSTGWIQNKEDPIIHNEPNWINYDKPYF